MVDHRLFCTDVLFLFPCEKMLGQFVHVSWWFIFTRSWEAWRWLNYVTPLEISLIFFFPTTKFVSLNDCKQSWSKFVCSLAAVWISETKMIPESSSCKKYILFVPFVVFWFLVLKEFRMIYKNMPTHICSSGQYIINTTWKILPYS